jgi:conjugal transfer pilus assembly protein TraE
LGLALNISPLSGSYQNERFLKFSAPESTGQLQADMGARADYLKKNNVSTQFAVNALKTDKDNLRVSFAGTLSTWVSDKKAPDRKANYVIYFKFINGQLYVSNFKETSEQDPFGVSAAPKS